MKTMTVYKGILFLLSSLCIGLGAYLVDMIVLYPFALAFAIFGIYHIVHTFKK